jgi:hypothetical protein
MVTSMNHIDQLKAALEESNKQADLALIGFDIVTEVIKARMQERGPNASNFYDHAQLKRVEKSRKRMLKAKKLLVASCNECFHVA